MTTPLLKAPVTYINGEFTLRRKCAQSGKVIQEVGPFSNLITDLGLNRIGTAAPGLYYCYVGTGTVPPAVTDTTMSTFKVATSTRNQANSAPSSPGWYAQTALTFTFAAGVAAGNLTEVGVGWAANPLNALWSRELTVDSSGNPVTITVLSTEILEVVYVLRRYFSTSDTTGSFVLNGITYNYTSRTSSVGSAILGTDNPAGAPFVLFDYAGASCALGPITGSIAGSTTADAGGKVRTLSPYVSGSYKLQGTTSYALNSVNLTGGIRAQQWHIGLVSGAPGFIPYSVQVLFDKAIPKTNLNTMSFTMETTWSRGTIPT